MKGRPYGRLARELPVWLGTAAAVGLTVGPFPALVILLLLVAERLWLPSSHVLGTAALVLLSMIPIAWFLGSSLPVFPPGPRVGDNSIAHQIGGLAVWTLFLAACIEVRSEESEPA